MRLTWLDSNSWLIEAAGKRILLDPWLVGSLTFGNAPWFFKSDRRSPQSIPAQIDFILLSQGLEDHAHPETLKALDRSIPVIGSPSAAKVVKELGFTTINSLAHGQVFTIPDLIKIHAVKGAPVGPTTHENGYILQDLLENTSLYYEPHGYHSPEIQEFAPVDVMIAPILDLKLPLLGSIIKGQTSAVQAAKLLKPQLILPTAGDGDLIYSGLLVKFLQLEGNADSLRSLLSQNQISAEVYEPISRETITVRAKKVEV
jgi:L-ascorbate metabolism protein UlaG (beta-lactamase superfamily)